MAKAHISEVQLRELAAKGMTWREIARMKGIREDAIRTAAGVLGVPSAHASHSRLLGGVLSAAMVMKLLAEGKSMSEIERTAEVRSGTVRSFLARRGLQTSQAKYRKAMAAKTL